MIWLYGLLCVLGSCFPLAAFLPWLLAHGADVSGFIRAADANPISLFAWLDVLIAGGCILLFIWHEGRRDDIAHYWLAMLATILVGGSLGLPLFLFMREWQRSTKR